MIKSIVKVNFLCLENDNTEYVWNEHDFWYKR